MTAPLCAVLTVLLAYPTAWQYGHNIANRTRLNPCIVHAILRRLHKAGWLCERDDRADYTRPVRRYYRLTEAGTTAARTVLDQIPPIPTVLRAPPPGYPASPWHISW